MRLITLRTSQFLRTPHFVDFDMAPVRNVDIPVVIVIPFFVLVIVGALVRHSALYVLSRLASYVSNVLDSFMYPNVAILYFFD